MVALRGRERSSETLYACPLQVTILRQSSGLGRGYMSDAGVQKTLYRILDFTRVVQIFETGQLYFTNPRVWDDPYEERIKHSRNSAIFAQCWSQDPSSDAMWRIYSQNGMGVRISTTEIKLKEALKAEAKKLNYQYRVKKVAYKSTSYINAEARKIADELTLSFDIRRAVDSLYMKRDAFRHEAEWRATIYSRAENGTDKKNGFHVPIDPHIFINRILLDPRAPNELVDAFKFYFQTKLGFEKPVGRSALYRSPEQYTVDNEITADHL